MTTAKQVLSTAASEIGTTSGSKYWKLVYPKYGYVNGSKTPYCACYVSWVLDQLGLKVSGFPSGYCPSVWNAAKKAKKTHAVANAKAGDIALFDWNGDGVADHIGFVEKVDTAKRYIQTIEGNTNGGKVDRRTRAYSTVLGVVRPDYSTYSLRGIDIYSEDGWPLKGSNLTAYKGSDFVVVKATQGLWYGNPLFTKQIEACEKDGKLLGVYHYAEGSDPAKEAEHFYKYASKWKGRVIPCLDWEQYLNSAWLNKTWCKKFAKRTKELWGVWPMVYTYASMLTKVASCWPECPLWVAGYPTDAATWKVPKFAYSTKPWKDYAIWQFTSGHDTTDRNTSNLTAKEWTDMANGTRTPLEVAVSQIGTKEQPANSNNVKYNTWYYGHKVSGSAYPWCAVFVAWCFDKAGDTSIKGVENRAYCPSYVSWAKKHGKWTSTPKPGHLALYDWNGDGVADHIGIVEKVVDKSTIQAIEGNTAVGNDSNGGEVMRRTRKLSTVLGFIDTHAEPKPEPKPKPATSTKYRVTAKPSLNVRDKRSTVKGKVVGSIANGQTVELKALKKNKVGNTWAEVASGKYKGRFVAVKFGGRTYAVKL